MCGPPPTNVQEKSAWSDEGAPYPSEKFNVLHLPWFVVIFLVATISILALNAGYLAASIFWIVYECYIVFDHGPFLFTDTVYKSPAFNYRRINLIFFWGMEAVACIVATLSDVGAPYILLYNAAPHFFFVGAHVNQTATSKAFVPSQMKTWWISAQVAIDNVIHLICLWYQLKYISTGFVPLLSWIGLVGSMVVLTLWFHADEMSLSYLFVVAGTESGRGTTMAGDQVFEPLPVKISNASATEPLPVVVSDASAIPRIGDWPTKKRRVSTDRCPLPPTQRQRILPRNAIEMTQHRIPQNNSLRPPETQVHPQDDSSEEKARLDMASSRPSSPDCAVGGGHYLSEEGASARDPADVIQRRRGIDDHCHDTYISGKPKLHITSSEFGNKPVSLMHTSIPMPSTIRLRTNRARMA